jgi:hypothetical protein
VWNRGIWYGGIGEYWNRGNMGDRAYIITWQAKDEIVLRLIQQRLH